MTFDELLKKYKSLLDENKQLRAKNAELREKLGINTNAKSSISSDKGKINKYSSVQEKLDLFTSLFIGRKDVYAKRWYNIKTEKSG